MKGGIGDVLVRDFVGVDVCGVVWGVLIGVV